MGTQSRNYNNLLLLYQRWRLGGEQQCHVPPPPQDILHFDFGRTRCRHSVSSELIHTIIYSSAVVINVFFFFSVKINIDKTITEMMKLNLRDFIVVPTEFEISEESITIDLFANTKRRH